MSILIKTMTKLPEHCYDCPCHDRESGYCQADKGNRYSDYRPFWCPLEMINDTCEAISEQAVLGKAFYTETEEGWSERTVDVKDIEALPSVTPKQKMGHWIEIAQYSDGAHKMECSECKSYIFDIGSVNSFIVKNKYKYCPNCGAEMREVEE